MGVRLDSPFNVQFEVRIGVHADENTHFTTLGTRMGLDAAHCDTGFPT